MPSFPAAHRRGAIATPHFLATRAGEDAYLRGGSAIDAALAAAAVLTVVYPHNTSLGGDAVGLVRQPDGTLACINATGCAARGVSREALLSRYGDAMPVTGIDTITVPGVVRGWEAARACGARLAWSEQLSRATSFAFEGVAVAGSLAGALQRASSLLAGDPGARSIYLDGSRLLEEGDTLRQPVLGETLRVLAEQGPGSFYEGEIGGELLSGIRKLGSVLAERDFAAFRAERTGALTATWQGFTVATSPPNTQGFLLLRFLGAMQRAGCSGLLPADAAMLARLFDEGNQIRDRYLADPRFADVNVEALIHAKPVTPGTSRQPVNDPRVPTGDTVGIVAADSDGYAISWIQSLFHHFGSGVVEPTTGILLQNRGASFSLHSGSANRIEPGKRPSHTLMPVMALKGERLAWVSGCMAGRAQAQTHTHLLLRHLAGHSARATAGGPRFVVGPVLAGEAGNTIHAEEDLPEGAITALRESGMPLVIVPARSELLGHANVLMLSAEGEFDAASDPRSDGSAGVVELPPR